ncbi:MAG: hypothetical protein ACI4TT_00570, partial [Christensenellales bacterium]
SELVTYKFAGEYTQEGDLLVSSSGVKIDNASQTLILCDIDSDVEETVVMTTEFGFESDASQSFTYKLIADYNVVTTSQEYYAPSIVDVFGNYQEVLQPDVSDLATYYELVGEQYVITTDIAIADGKTYYKQVEPAVKFTNKAGTVLHLPRDYNLNNLTFNYINKFASQVAKPDANEIANYYELIDGQYQITTDTTVYKDKTYYLLNIKYDLKISNLGKYCSFTNYGKIKIHGIPQEETIVSAIIGVLDEEQNLGFSQDFEFTIKPAVSCNFVTNDKDSNKNAILSVQTVVKEDENNNEFDGISNVVDLKDKLIYTNLNDSTVKINKIEFSAGYISMLDVDALDGNTIVKYQQTADTSVDDGKTYYVKTSTGYSKVKSPNNDEISNYYETVTYAKLEFCRYKQADTTFDLSKTYYVKNSNGYRKVESPNEAEILNYYERETYEKIPNNYTEDNVTFEVTLCDEILENNISDFQIKIKVEASVLKDEITTNLTGYYFIKFVIPNGN